jgi:pimeloyl-ACP methyl ester carboxylesterase
VHGHAWILHGQQDSAIPVDMSESLAHDFPKTVTLKTIPGAGHNDFFGATAKDV